MGAFTERGLDIVLLQSMMYPTFGGRKQNRG